MLEGQGGAPQLNMPEPSTCAALHRHLDRPVHHSEVITIHGDSYRLRGKRREPRGRERAICAWRERLLDARRSLAR